MSTNAVRLPHHRYRDPLAARAPQYPPETIMLGRALVAVLAVGVLVAGYFIAHALFSR